MNYIIEWDEKIIRMLNQSKLGKSSYGPLPKWGLTTNIHSSKPVYIYIGGASQREDIFIKGSYHYSPPMIETNILDYGDKKWIKDGIKSKRLFILSKDVSIEAIEEIINIERQERENSYVPEIVKPFIVKLNWNNILHDCNK